jgi:hypothetical protein
MSLGSGKGLLWQTDVQVQVQVQDELGALGSRGGRVRSSAVACGSREIRGKRASEREEEQPSSSERGQPLATQRTTLELEQRR